MRKSLIDTTTTAAGPLTPGDDARLDLDQVATVEITSEDPLFPIESALGARPSNGWRASSKGVQYIRLTFDAPTHIRRIQLHFIDRAAERSQEFAIYAKSEGAELREAIRQQFTFSPGGSTEESEDYTVDLSGIIALELRIDPDRAHDPTHSQHFATLQSLRLA